MIKRLESSKGDSSTILPGSKQNLGSTMGSIKVVSRFPSISKEHLLMPNHSRDVRTRLEFDLFSEYQSNVPNEVDNFAIRDKEVAIVQPLFVKSRL